MTTEHVWPCLSCTDAHKTIAFLQEAFGFEPTEVVDGGDVRPVAHAELLTPWGGGVMLGSHVPGEEPFATREPGAANIYVVVDDPDALFARCTAAGAEVVRPLEDASGYESRGFTVRDPDGNLWAFGTYAGAPRP
jgi:uncharacterized glyoxalase superfamily protein PhnB